MGSAIWSIVHEAASRGPSALADILLRYSELFFENGQFSAIGPSTHPCIGAYVDVNPFQFRDHCHQKTRVSGIVCMTLFS